MRVSRSLFLNIYNLCHAKLLEVKNILLMSVTPSAPKTICFDHRCSITIRNGIEFLKSRKALTFSHPSWMMHFVYPSLAFLRDSTWWHPRHLLPASLYLTPPLLCGSLVDSQGRNRYADVENGGAEMGWIGRLGLNTYTSVSYICTLLCVK